MHNMGLYLCIYHQKHWGQRIIYHGSRDRVMDFKLEASVKEEDTYVFATHLKIWQILKAYQIFFEYGKCPILLFLYFCFLRQKILLMYFCLHKNILSCQSKNYYFFVFVFLSLTKNNKVSNSIEINNQHVWNWSLSWHTFKIVSLCHGNSCYIYNINLFKF